MAEKNLKNKKAFDGYSDFFLAKENYSEAEGAEKLRETLRSFKGIRSEFLEKAEEKDGLLLQRGYIPVYRLSAEAEYVWETGGSKSASPKEHREKRTLGCVLTQASAALKTDEWKDGGSFLSDGGERPAPIFEEYLVPYRESVRRLKREAADYSPDSTARTTLEDMRYEVIFVPVLKAVCAYGDREYEGFVNLHNGAVAAEYPVSRRIEEGVGKALKTIGTAKLNVLFAALFIAVFAVLSLVKKLRPESAVATAVVAGLFALLLVPAACFLRCIMYRRKDMEERAGSSGKISGALTAVLLAIASWTAAAFALFLFGVNVL